MLRRTQVLFNIKKKKDILLYFYKHSFIRFLSIQHVVSVRSRFFWKIVKHPQSYGSFFLLFFVILSEAFLTWILADSRNIMRSNWTIKSFLSFQISFAFDIRIGFMFHSVVLDVFFRLSRWYKITGKECPEITKEREASV